MDFYSLGSSGINAEYGGGLVSTLNSSLRGSLSSLQREVHGNLTPTTFTASVSVATTTTPTFTTTITVTTTTTTETTTTIQPTATTTTTTTTTTITTQPSTKGLCSICLEGNVPLFALKRCNHSFCMNCLEEYLKTNIMEHNLPLICPDRSCTARVENSDVKALVTPELPEEYLLI
eukprot:TRINITY_DN5268_c0_g2_i6.p2 TRINITY_DN5268_c0_g2~~TRINITY_DN5268_c0_g2_i6.p2  ORF type:complete len:176 (+),score=37.85 TRINITY_DN5268_c0_g2_i6:110-637(+)